MIAFWMHSLGAKPEITPPKVTRLAVETTSVSAYEGLLEIQADGTIGSLQNIGVNAQVAGEIVGKSKNCRTGRMVQKGEVLFQIDPKDYELAHQQSKKEKEQAEANYRLTELELVQAKKEVQLQQRNLRLVQSNLDRIRGLRKQNVVSQTDLDNAERSFITAQTTLKQQTDQVQISQKKLIQLKAQWDLATVAENRAQVNLQRTTVRAPITGRISQCMVEQGGFVSGGGKLITLQDSGQLEVQADLLFWQLQWMKSSDAKKKAELKNPVPVSTPQTQVEGGVPEIGSIVEFVVDGVSYYWPAYLSSLNSAGMDAGTRMIPVRLTIDQDGALPEFFRPDDYTPDQENRPQLMSGMYVQSRFFFESPFPVILLPSACIHPGETVWFEEDGVLKRTKIKVFQFLGDNVVAFSIDGSLTPGVDVITSPLPNPVTGMPLKKVSAEGQKEKTNDIR